MIYDITYRFHGGVCNLHLIRRAGPVLAKRKNLAGRVLPYIGTGLSVYQSLCSGLLGETCCRSIGLW